MCGIRQRQCPCQLQRLLGPTLQLTTETLILLEISPCGFAAEPRLSYPSVSLYASIAEHSN